MIKLKERMAAFRRRRRARELSRLLAEERKRNVMLGHVMFQRKTRRPFLTAALERTAAAAGLAGAGWQEYHRLLFLYNKAVAERDRFRAWYQADLDRQNRENARELDRKEDDVEAIFHQAFTFLSQSPDKLMLPEE